jgi:hypothetical protein
MLGSVDKHTSVNASHTGWADTAEYGPEPLPMAPISVCATCMS